jgi:hypothetical protein
MNVTVNLPESVLRGIAKNAPTYDRKGCPQAARLARAVGAALPVEAETVIVSDLGVEDFGRTVVAAGGSDLFRPFVLEGVVRRYGNSIHLLGGDAGMYPLSLGASDSIALR